MQVTFRLMQEAGVQGLTAAVSIPAECPWPDLRRQAIAWADGQIGHPWDCLVVEFPDGENEPFDAYSHKAPGVPV